MITLQLAATCIAAVMLFLHSLQSFSREIRVLGKDKLRAWLITATRNRFTGFAIGRRLTPATQQQMDFTRLP